MQMTNKKLLTNSFGTKAEAEAAYNSLLERGYRPDDITLIMNDETREGYLNDVGIKTEKGSKLSEGLAVGGTVGGTLGGIVAAIATLGSSLLLPGLGIVVAGPLAAGLAGVGAGSIAGGFIGALIGFGIPEETVKAYEAELNKGGILIGVHPHSEEEYASIASDWNKYKV